MQSRFSQELHQRRQTAALVTRGTVEREAFIAGMLSDTQLTADAISSFLAHLRRSEVSGPLFSLAAAEARGVVLRTAYRRCDDLLCWQAARSPLAGWWGLQASFEYNNDGRRFAEGLYGYVRSTRQTFALESDTQVTEPGVLAFTALVDEAADPALRFERSNASQELYNLLALAVDSTAAAWLREWLDADALDRNEPVVFSASGARLSWHYGAQRSVASSHGVTERTLRNRSRRVELMLTGLVRFARAA